MKTETKKLCRPLELKSLDDTGHFEGYASVFGVEDSYRDVVAKGAFTRTIAEHKGRGSMPKLLWQHDPSNPIGVFDDMFEDNYGLKVTGRLLLDVEKAKEAYVLLKHKAIDGISIGYSTRRYEIVEGDGDDAGIRKLLDVELWEASLVTFPANDAALVTNVKNKDGQDELPTVREFERWLQREAKFSRADAETIIRKGFKSLLRQREAAISGDLIVESDLLDSLKNRSAFFNHKQG